MKHRFGSTIVIALGGSIVYPDAIDTAFVKRLKAFALRYVRARGKKLIIVVGGGKLARLFQTAAGKITNVANEDKDWLGIHATRLNAHLLRTVFKAIADPVVIDERFKIKKLRHPITIASGWQPGWSTDFIASALASDFGANEFVIAGKPPYVYDKNPDAAKDARPLERMRWSQYRNVIPARWVPGSHAPVDPVAARFAHMHAISAIVVNCKDLKNLQNLLNNREFKGTIIE